MNISNKISTWSGKFRRGVFNPLLWLVILGLGIRRRAHRNENASYSICVTTFVLRYQKLFKPLLRKLAFLFPDVQIIVIANGHHDRAAQEKYIAALSEYASLFPNVYLVSFLEPQGLSALWNLAVQRSRSERVFIFNDDIDISPHLRREIETSGMLSRSFATNGGSWSQFMISKAFYHHIGPFDEGLKEIGGEDDDYLIRMKILGIEDQSPVFQSTWGKKSKIKVNSYGRVVKEQKSGYSTYNTDYLESKWEKSPVPLEGGVFVRGSFWRLRQTTHSVANRTHA